jgi:N-acetylmuramoyl-L-alanine amidase
MRFPFHAAMSASVSLLTLGALALSTPASQALADDSVSQVQHALLPASVIEAAALEGQTPSHALPDLSLPAPRTATSQLIAKPIRMGGSLSDMVASYSSAQTPSREAECLAVAVYYESKGEPLAGQLAVAETILNRTRSGRFPTTICGVVLQKSQFSFVRGGVLPGVARGSQMWKTAVAVAHIAQNNLAESSVGSALFFHARYVSPGWKLRRLGSVGNHIFYR